MEIFIYKITNIINNKIYIGQSNNPNNRFKQHMACRSSSKSISQDVTKYGKENFTLEILENVNEDISREMYYIKLFKEQGFDLYNKTKGGENPPSFYGEDNSFSTITKEDSDKIKDLLKFTFFGFEEIGKMLNVSRHLVYHINIGSSWRDESLNYPLQPLNYFDYIYDNIVNDLLTTSLLQREIANKYGIARSTITMINIGQNHFNPKYNYPLRPRKY